MSPKFNTNGYKFNTKCLITLKGLNEEFLNCKARIVGSVENSNVLDSGFGNITSETFKHQYDHDQYPFSKGLTSSGSLVLNVEVIINLQKEPPKKVIKENTSFLNKYIVDNIEKMLEDSRFSDFKFIVQGKEFKVHRAILASTSSVFARMFTAGMTETHNAECKVEDIEPDIFDHLMRFIYCGKLPEDLAAVSMKLYESAHYYEIEQLKEICRQEFSSILKTENAVKIFEWACHYEENELKMEAWLIIKQQ